MAGCRNLKVERWAAILVARDRAGGENLLGSHVSDDQIPAALRRRMGRMERLAVRCTLGVLQSNKQTDEIVYCSRSGNVDTLYGLLHGLGTGELMSAIAFSGSVHNAVPGLVGQCRKERISHTALAGGVLTFMAGLVECYTRLILDECQDVTLTYADLPFPEGYSDFEEEQLPGIVLSMRLAPGPSESDGMPVELGREGVIGVLERLNGGGDVVSIGRLVWNELRP